MAVRPMLWALLTVLVLVGCHSPGDPQQIGAHARAVKSVAADTTNAWLYVAATLTVQTRDLKAIERGFTLLKDDPKAQNLTGFQSLLPQLIGLSETLRFTRPVRAEIKASILRAQTVLDEIHKAIPGLTADLSTGRSALGDTANVFDQAQGELGSSVKNLEESIGAMTAYVESANDMETAVNGMLRELDILSQGATNPDQTAAIVRLHAFDDNLMAGLQKLTAAIKSEGSSQDEGLAALLKCFKSLESISDLPEDLSKEIREAIKLLDDVSKGLPFSPKPM
ncbi:MAG: hypothetical protein DMF56_02365 [Acidobacteria bacterium]|nr:MAG: hypothetical protein DMF56_02365 [Acidobacteriota bacterium]